MTSDTFKEQVYYRISKGKPEEQAGIWRAAIQSTLDACLQDLATRTYKAGQPKRALLQKVFNFTLSGGEVALSGEPTLLKDYIPSGYLTLGGKEVVWLPQRQDLVWPPPIGDFFFYSIFSGKFIVRDKDGAIPASTALAVNASFIPIISEVPQELQDDLIAIGITLAAGIDIAQWNPQS